MAHAILLENGRLITLPMHSKDMDLCDSFGERWNFFLIDYCDSIISVLTKSRHVILKIIHSIALVDNYKYCILITNLNSS